MLELTARLSVNITIFNEDEIETNKKEISEKKQKL